MHRRNRVVHRDEAPRRGQSHHKWPELGWKVLLAQAVHPRRSPPGSACTNRSVSRSSHKCASSAESNATGRSVTGSCETECQLVPPGVYRQQDRQQASRGVMQIEIFGHDEESRAKGTLQRPIELREMVFWKRVPRAASVLNHECIVIALGKTRNPETPDHATCIKPTREHGLREFEKRAIEYGKKCYVNTPRMPKLK